VTKLPPTNNEVKSAWIYTSGLLHALKAFKENFTFTFTSVHSSYIILVTFNGQYKLQRTRNFPTRI
jgi:hypothetical protein